MATLVPQAEDGAPRTEVILDERIPEGFDLEVRRDRLREGLVAEYQLEFPVDTLATSSGIAAGLWEMIPGLYAEATGIIPEDSVEVAVVDHGLQWKSPTEIAADTIFGSEFSHGFTITAGLPVAYASLDAADAEATLRYVPAVKDTTLRSELILEVSSEEPLVDPREFILQIAEQFGDSSLGDVAPETE